MHSLTCIAALNKAIWQSPCCRYFVTRKIKILESNAIFQTTIQCSPQFAKEWIWISLMLMCFQTEHYHVEWVLNRKAFVNPAICKTFLFICQKRLNSIVTSAYQSFVTLFKQKNTLLVTLKDELQSFGLHKKENVHLILTANIHLHKLFQHYIHDDDSLKFFLSDKQRSGHFCGRFFLLNYSIKVTQALQYSVGVPQVASMQPNHQNSGHCKNERQFIWLVDAGA